MFQKGKGTTYHKILVMLETSIRQGFVKKINKQFAAPGHNLKLSLVGDQIKKDYIFLDQIRYLRLQSSRRYIGLHSTAIVQFGSDLWAVHT